jgi:hypothetical protein
MGRLRKRPRHSPVDPQGARRRSAGPRAWLVGLAFLLGTGVLSAQDNALPVTRYTQFSLFYSYRALPENRAALREYMDTAGVRQFEKWKSEGTIRDYVILFSSYVRINSVPWDMLIRIDFNRYADTDKWLEVERTMPAGLSPQALALATPENLNVGETLSASGMTYQGAAKAVYDVSYYRFKVPLPVGKNFIQGYVLPQLEAFTREKVLAGYGLYLNKYELTDWSYLILSEYADSTALDQRLVNKSKIRSLLDPAWKTLNDMKAEHVRDEPHGFLAVRIVPR